MAEKTNPTPSQPDYQLTSEKKTHIIYFLGRIIGLFLIGGFIATLFLIEPPFDVLYPIAIALWCIIGGLLVPCGIHFLINTVPKVQLKISESHRNLFMAILYGCGFVLTCVNLPKLFTDDFSYWIIRENGSLFEVAFLIMLSAIMTYEGGYCLFLFIIYNKNNKNSPDLNKKWSSLRIQAISFIIFIIIGSSGFLFFSVATPPRDYAGCVGESTPNYALPSGSHYNAKLNLLDASNQSLLAKLELALWSFTKLRQPCGGFPMYCTSDFCQFVGDGGSLWPNEIDIQLGTQAAGEVYLLMYQLEPNPIYLTLARGAGDALVGAQDNIDGGFYKYAVFDENNQSIQPSPRNPRRISTYDDDTMQGAMRFLLRLYNFTKETKYLDALNKGFVHLASNQYAWGAWPQETHFIYPYYHIYSTLNDGLMEDMFDLYMLAIQILPDRTTEFRDIIDKAFNWLQDVQGNGGSEIQAGAWAQQYDFDQQPYWARAFEPPAMESSGTAGFIKKFIDLYCFFNDTKYLAPIPAAIAWLKVSNISYLNEDGNSVIGWSRLYELGTNKPIYGLADGGPDTNPPYVYDAPVRSGYNWQDDWGYGAFERWDYLNITAMNDITMYQSKYNTPSSLSSARNSAISAVSNLNFTGFWIDEGNRIHVKEFRGNTEDIIDYLRRL